MGFQQFEARQPLRDLFARFAGVGVWILATLVPAAFLARLFALTLYAIPESDDFCLSFQNAAYGFIETARIWYVSAVGRIVPLFLIQIPAAISGASGLDYFLSYTATLAALEISFAAAMLLVAFRLWPEAKPWQNVFMAVALLAVTLSRLPSLREMLFWLPGVTCYTVPGAIVAIMLVEFVRAAEANTRIGRRTTGALVIASFVASLCNEFTPAWLVGLVLCSLIIRAVYRQDLQIREHAIIGLAALVGFLIMLFAPGNAVRIGQFPLAGDLKRSLVEGYRDTRVHFRGAQWLWLVVVAIFSVMEPETSKVSTGKRLLLAVLVPMFCLACGFLAFFAAQYSTGSLLAARAQNQVLMLLLVGSTISVAVLSRSIRTAVSSMTTRPIMLPHYAQSIVAILLGAFLILPLNNSETARVVRSDRSSLRAFWLESLERHARLTLSMEPEAVVPRHSVSPSTLVGEDLGENPSRLPNDCVARFYGKKSVMLLPRKETVADILPIAATMIHDIRAKQAFFGGDASTPASLLSRSQDFASPLGRVVLTRSAGTSTLDFYSLPQKACPELLSELSKIEGVLRVAGSARSAEEQIAPIGPDVSRLSCAADGTFARVILDMAH
jgi:Family of unknown function (DUF6056)